MTAHLIRLLELYVERDSLRSQLRVLGVPCWPWDSNASLRRRLDLAVDFGWPSEAADPRWMGTLEERMMRAGLRLMQAIGVEKR